MSDTSINKILDFLKNITEESNKLSPMPIYNYTVKIGGEKNDQVYETIRSVYEKLYGI